MMIKRALLTLSVFIAITVSVLAQQHGQAGARIIFIGDAGEMDSGQASVIKHAASQVIAGKTTVFFLGDNIYPNGMGLPGSTEERATQEILRSQFAPLRAKGAPVYFIPGNHDWDRSGKQGLLKVKQQGIFLAAQKDSLLKLIPPNGCPDPIEINISANVTVIAFDSEWWLTPQPAHNESGGCNCTTKEDVTKRLRMLAEKNKGKIILLASHHPFMTYGSHGGYKQIPLIGDLYRATRLAFPSRQDVAHPRYKAMIKQVNSALKDIPNVIHMAGHDHGLQLIKDDYIQVVSGSGAKSSSLVKGEHSLFADARQGYVIADLVAHDQLKLTFFVSKFEDVTEAFTILIKANASD